MNSTNAPRRILIVRMTAIGDCVHTLPVANALRDRYPDAYLAWIAEGVSAKILQGHPALDEIIAVPRRWMNSWKEVLRVRRELLARRFDTAIDVQGLTKSALTAWLSGARRRIGYRGVDGRELSPWLNNTLVEPKSRHVIDRNVELLKPLGIVNPPVKFELPEGLEDAQSVDGFLRRFPAPHGFALINTGAGWSSKLWPTDRFARVARHLRHAHGLAVLVLWAGEDERKMAEEIVGQSGNHAQLAPKTSLTELAAFSRRAKLFVGSDTGPLHIAAAVGTPCVGLFGPMPKERNGPYGRQHIAIQSTHAPEEGESIRKAGPESMQAISVAQVCSACDQILTRPQRRSA